MIKETILYLDDEILNLEAFDAVFEKKYNIITTKSAFDALSIIEKNPLIKVIISDYRMPEMTGLDFFKTIANRFPEIICILLTAYSDIDITLQAINQGGIYRYILKPWNKEEMRLAIDNAIETYNLKLVNKTLINSLKNKNAILLESEEKYKKLVDSTVAGYLITQGNKITYFNKSFCEILEIDKNTQIENADIYNIFNTEDIINIINKLKTNYEYSFTLQSNTKKTVLLNSTEIEINKVKHIQTTLFDITQLRESQNQLIEAKQKIELADNLKTAFLANISHEIRTPLNGIVGFSSLICDLDVTKEEKKEYYEIIRSNSEYLVNTINDVIEISKANTNSLDILIAPTKVIDIIKNVEFSFKHEIISKKLNFEIKQNKSIDVVLTDNILFKKIIYNLLSNAVKFTEKGDIEINYYLTDNETNIEFSISDTGIGIDKSQFDIIFENFRQLDFSTAKKYKGTGLGLALVKAYVNKLNGKIRVESEVEKGSTFYFKIPYIIPENEDITKVYTKKNIKKILIADDEDVNLFYLETVLQKSNIKTYRASNGIDAVKICKAHKDIDLVLMDIKMPHLDGIKALQQIKEINSKILIIALTSYTEEKNRVSLLNVGFDYFLEKPVNRIELIDLIKRL